MKTQDLANNAKLTGQYINGTKNKAMCINTELDTPITIDGTQIDTTSTVIDTQKSIKNRLAKAKSDFARLRQVWKSTIYSNETKLELFNSVVKAPLMNGSEC
ncbi:RNA-directed DNA polymerase from mobile element jockey [Brachionus plicatilis]|uniref:RNA-directed DNA polymerase from mobile element jockey n=1 Tax=Brachionus plicatilis TaxID=10195 RepID=A0A3M7QVX9_BRAPC|nr:RNA-directed DNA polymerase from mobile element jockey [Brachionus plicatilis]